MPINTRRRTAAAAQKNDDEEDLHDMLSPNALTRLKRRKWSHQQSSPEGNLCVAPDTEPEVIQDSESILGMPAVPSRNDPDVATSEFVIDTTVKVELMTDPLEIILSEDGSSTLESTTQPESQQNHDVQEQVSTTEDQLLLDDFAMVDDSDDEDLNCLAIPLAAPRDVAINQADNTTLPLPRSLEKILRIEEKASDVYLHEIVPSDDYYDFQWTNDPNTFTGKRETFTGVAGPTFQATERVIEVFYKMFDTDIIDLLVVETNRYAEQSLNTTWKNSASGKYVRGMRWAPTNRDEMVTFLAVFILQGLYPKNKEERYFKADGFGTTPYFTSIMTYDRYILLNHFFHFTDNKTEKKDRTKLKKIQPVIDYLNNKFSTLYLPKQDIVIGESLMKCHGRLSLSQKISTKASEVGCKIYELCEASSGYLWRFFVCAGNDEQNKLKDQTASDGTNKEEDGQNVTSDDDDERQASDNEGLLTNNNSQETDCNGQANDSNLQPNEKSKAYHPLTATSKIVYDLVKPLLRRGHSLAMDSFYNSPLLARLLKRQQTDLYGTLRLTREFVPDSLKRVHINEFLRGEVSGLYCADVSVIMWRDANLMSLISTYHHVQIGKQIKNNKPQIVVDYNKAMGGLDRKDQFLASQPLERQHSKIWYKKLFRRLFNDALHNCFVIFASGNPTMKLKERQFRIQLAEDLLKVHRHIDLSGYRVVLKMAPTAMATVTHPSTTVTLQLQKQTRPYVDGNHFPTSSASRNSRCWMCTRNKKSSRTAFKCEECEVNLCIRGCFKEFHKPPR